MIDLDYKVIGRNIRQFRLKKGLRQKTLAEMVHLTDQHISHIENATTQLSLPTLVSIANALEVDCNTLLGETLYGAQEKILRHELLELLDRIGNDQSKLRLRIALCRLLEEYEQ